MRSNDEELEEEIEEEEVIEDSADTSADTYASTADETVGLLVGLIESLVTTPNPDADVFSDNVSMGCVHPQTATSLISKINNAWNGERRGKMDRTVTACVAMVSSLCSSLGVEAREPSKG